MTRQNLLVTVTLGVLFTLILVLLPPMVIRLVFSNTSDPVPFQGASPSSVPLSSAVWAGDTLYISGKGSRDPQTGKHPEGFEAQVRQSLENCAISLKEAGLSFADVVNSNVYLTDIKTFQAMNKVYKTYFPHNPPARTTIAVPALPGDSQVEITLIASRSAAHRRIVPQGMKVSEDDLFSMGMEVGDVVYLSGQGSRHYLTKEFPSGGFEEHVRQALENLEAVLKAAGLDFSHVVKSDVYLTDIGNIDKMNEVYKSYFKADRPVRATVGVAALPGDPPIEITLVAAKSLQARKIVAVGAANPGLPFSPVVVLGDRVFLSGKAGFAKGGIEPQVKEVMDGLGEALKASSLDFSNVVEGKVYLADIKEYEAMNQVYASYFKGMRPARTCVAVSKLVADSRVEISFVASKQKK
ncbi:MAG TPA: RidA family protein [Terriglobia bacterium]|nr:RidA family protein [Terriglobia bacterium]